MTLTQTTEKPRKRRNLIIFWAYKTRNTTFGTIFWTKNSPIYYRRKYSQNKAIF